MPLKPVKSFLLISVSFGCKYMYICMNGMENNQKDGWNRGGLWLYFYPCPAVIQLQPIVVVVFLSPQGLVAMPLERIFCQNTTKQRMCAETPTSYVCIMAHINRRGEGDPLTHSD